MSDYPYSSNNSPTNAQEYSVTEVSLALKRTVEDQFGYVRIRGEISGSKRAASGHVYLALKDDKSVLDGVMWKGVAGKLTFRPEDGLEVVVTGKLTTYPGRSKYQIVIDKMEVAGEGALMALLEKRKKELAAEGLFDPARKLLIPYLPKVIGVVTSPTGSVIRDILHRLSDRFPRHVLVWPVLVQGEGAQTQIAEAIDGFNALEEGGEIPKPDVLIVARGGGSLEDLWCFNEEEVVRAVSRSDIPLISAVGHETDTTLIDYVADLRAPTPTAAAEKAVPVRADLIYTVRDLDTRHEKAIRRRINELNERVEGLGRGLPKPSELLGLASQRFDEMSDRLPRALKVGVERQSMRLDGIGRMLRPESIISDMKRKDDQLNVLEERMNRAIENRIGAKRSEYESPARLLESLSYHRVLERGFAVIRDEKGKAISEGKGIAKGAALGVEFRDGVVDVVRAGKPAPKKKKQAEKPEQGTLL
ncbi:exodeoxyribonuclease VII large subunit [Pseudemcibacter aquimaris]|uniref:exodeoxyribonuclease VII large subunit n=1 Tax=Pseudemcibacter aquimaris TaxID=2857064 RepID=UPI0020127202|nr:exodeoxyribonuclease VII large subunit [Pseudemcibacter aquimaris]MCC3862302.1 exodeoxyribonuclease VII large subunit [Pseudemcibacter aquimaris]WDU59050.1 exodeoxyribonuclease VII large subunit [Pseudemcibacter aquimaris]